MASYGDENYTFYYAAFGLNGLTFIASAVISGVALCVVRRRSDIARSWIPYFKAAFSIFAFGLFVRCLTYAVNVAEINLPYYEGYSSSRSLYEAGAYLSELGQFFCYVAEILMFLTLIVLGCCITIAQCGQAQAPDRIVKFVAFGFAGLIGILVFVQLCLGCAIYSYTYKGGYDSSTGSYESEDKIAKLGKSNLRIIAAQSILLMIAAVFALAWSIVVTIRGPRNKGMSKSPSILLIVSAALFLLEKVYDMATYFKYSFPKEHNYPEHMRIVSIVFGMWPEFVLLIILFALGIKKRSGVWANKDGFVDAQVAPQDVAYGYQGQPQYAPQQYYVQHPVQQYQYQHQNQHQNQHQPQQYVTEQKFDQQQPQQPQQPQETHQQYTHQSQELSSQGPVYTHGATS